MALASGREQATNVLLVLTRQRLIRHGGDTAARARQNYIPVVNADELGAGRRFSRSVSPVPQFRHDPRRNEARPAVDGPVGLDWRILGCCGSGRRRRGAERYRRVFDLLIFLQLANQLLVVFAQLVEGNVDKLAILKENNVAI